MKLSCRYCGEHIGELDAHPKVIDLLQQELSYEEFEHMIKANENGEWSIQLVCETCEETLIQNPQLLENDNFIH